MGATGHPEQSHSLNISFVWSWEYDHALCDQEGSMTSVLLLDNYAVKWHDAFQEFMKISVHLL